MAADLRIAAHSIHPDRQVCEVWWDGVFVAQVTTLPGEGLVRVISKHKMEVSMEPPGALPANVANVRLAP